MFWTPPKPVGVSLLAKAAGQSISLLSDTPLSRAGS
ncbi:manganese ABC transporter ATP-binding protein, partial [Pseudomonas sp. MPR-ANC1]